MAVHAYVPAVAGGFRVVEHQAADGSLTFGLFKLVQPSAIIGHIASPEKGGVVVAGVVHHGYHNLSLDVYVGVVVPAVLRRMDAEAAEYVFGLGQFHPVLSLGGPDYQVFGILQIGLLLSLHGELIAFRFGRDGDDLERLEPAAFKGRLQTHLLQFFR